MLDSMGHPAGSRTRPSAEDLTQRLVEDGLKLLNPFMKRALASPMHFLFSRWFVLLSFTGRKSGRSISTPVSFFATGNGIVVTTKRPWWRNLEATGAVDTTVAGRRAGMSVQVVRGEDAVAKALRGAPGWFLFFAALDDGRLGRADETALRRSAREGRIVLRLGSRDAGAPTHRAASEGTAQSPAES
jgi:hypothetical protein